MHRLFVLLGLMASPLAAQDRAGEFDYYVMSLSWSANWCALEGDARNSPQCDPAAEFGWILHGLWPQYERGYPTNCVSAARPPSRSDTAEMADIMGTSGLAWHQWRKHGVCTGLSSDDYYALSREAYGRVTRPEVFRTLEKEVTLPASLIEEAFLRDNPDLAADQITITCKSGYIQEARICMTRDLEFRDCGHDVIRDCAMTSAQFDPMR
ncbi:MAG: ribonuclease T2 [Pseudomonadota bacterium]